MRLGIASLRHVGHTFESSNIRGNGTPLRRLRSDLTVPSSRTLALSGLPCLSQEGSSRGQKGKPALRNGAARTVVLAPTGFITNTGRKPEDRSMVDLRGMVVMITGAGGIGSETVRAFAREGCRVAVCDRLDDRLESAREQLERCASEVS